MRRRWTPAAAADLEAISDYVRKRYPELRVPTDRKIYEGIQALKAAPYLGRVGRVEGTRKLLFLPLPYIAVYRVQEETIEIWRIFHGAQGRFADIEKGNGPG